MAYHRAAEFFAWVERHKIGQLAHIEPLHVAAYVGAIGTRIAKPTMKTTPRRSDWLVTGGILTVKPGPRLRGPTSSSAAIPLGKSVQPEATGAVIEAMKRLKPTVSVSRFTVLTAEHESLSEGSRDHLATSTLHTDCWRSRSPLANQYNRLQ
jgi:hypothetical protein